MKQTDTPAFRRWFGDSKVIDENGEPLVVWHSTRGHFLEPKFDMDRANDIGMHFGTSDAAKQVFGSSRLSRPSPYFLKVSNFIEASDPNDWTSFYSISGKEPFIDQLLNQGVISLDEYKAYERISLRPANRQTLSKYLRELLISKGIDGIKYENEYEDVGETSWVVFDPRQIKSAKYNEGTFDPENPIFVKNPARAARDYQAKEQVRVRYGDEEELEEQTVWKTEPAYLTEGHFDSEEVKDATAIAEEVYAAKQELDAKLTGGLPPQALQDALFGFRPIKEAGEGGHVTVTVLGQGNFGVVYKAEMDSGVLSVKLPARADVHGRPWTRDRIQPLLLHEAGIANELVELGIGMAPRSIYVELSDGTPAIVREYGEPVKELSPEEFYEVEQKLMEIEAKGFKIHDLIQLYRREDGSLYVADVGIWQRDARRLKPHKKGWSDSLLPGLLGSLAREMLGSKQPYASLPLLLNQAKGLKEAIDEFDPKDENVFLKITLEDLVESIKRRSNLGLPVPDDLVELVERAEALK